MPSHPGKLNNRLWITRIKRGLARKKLAALLGHRTTSQLCRWEDGSVPSLENALLLGYLLQAPLEWLFGGLCEVMAREVAARRPPEEGDDVEANALAPTESIREESLLTGDTMRRTRARRYTESL